MNRITYRSIKNVRSEFFEALAHLTLWGLAAAWIRWQQYTDDLIVGVLLQVRCSLCETCEHKLCQGCVCGSVRRQVAMASGAMDFLETSTAVEGAAL